MRWFWLKHPSTYLALATWGAVGFMAQPTLASGFVHLCVAPPMFAGIVWLARQEGKSR